ncbi:MAG: DUF6785 family protein, partial [Armatimonadota bacterium]
MAKVLGEIAKAELVEERPKISWRTFLLGFLLIPVCAYWMARRGQDGIMSLSVPPVAFVFLLAVFNFPIVWLGRNFTLLRRLALTQADLAAMWAMLAVATGIACEWSEAPGLSGFL